MFKALSYKESYYECVSILAQYMKNNNITVSEIAQHLNVPRKKLGEVLNKKRIDVELLNDLCAILLCANLRIEIDY